MESSSSERKTGRSGTKAQEAGFLQNPKGFHEEEEISAILKKKTCRWLRKLRRCLGDDGGKVHIAQEAESFQEEAKRSGIIKKRLAR